MSDENHFGFGLLIGAVLSIFIINLAFFNPFFTFLFVPIILIGIYLYEK